MAGSLLGPSVLEVVRDATVEDARVLGRIEVETWRAAYEGLLPGAHLAAMSAARAEARWVRAIGMPRYGSIALTLVAEVDGEVVAFASGGGRMSAGTRMARLDMLYVLPAHQGRGLGRALLCAFAARLVTSNVTSMWLEVLEKNVPARRFYRALGGIPLTRTWAFWGTQPLVHVAYGWSLPDGLARMG